MANPRPSFKIAKGTVLNPKGRPPKDWTMASLIRDAGEEADDTGVPRNMIIARKLATLAARGDMQAIKEFNNRLDGMPKQPVEIGNKDDKPFYVELPRKMDTPQKTD